MDKELEKKFKPLKANVTVDFKLLFREQEKKNEKPDNKQNSGRR